MEERPIIIIRPWPKWVPISEAVTYTGNSEEWLKAMVRKGKITGGPDPNDKRGKGRWRINLKSVDDYFDRAIGNDRIKSAALASLDRLGIK